MECRRGVRTVLDSSLCYDQSFVCNIEPEAGESSQPCVHLVCVFDGVCGVAFSSQCKMSVS